MLLTATALAADTGYMLTYDHPEELCTFTVSDDAGKTYSSGDTVPAGGDFLTFKITNIASGYRIKSVMMNDRNMTEDFVDGGYGFLAMGLYKDTFIKVELELIPASLPSVTSVTLCTDLACTQAAPENITYTADSKSERLYGKAVYSDGEYPRYYGSGQWEYTTDGTNWKPARAWGSNRWDFWPGWQGIDGSGHPELNFLTASYDIRLCVKPTNLYTTGENVYSNVIHVNGGASANPSATGTLVGQNGKLAWQINGNGSALRVDGTLQAEDMVVAACKDAAGRFIGVAIVRNGHMETKLPAGYAAAKLLWLNAEKIPLCEYAQTGE